MISTRLRAAVLGACLLVQQVVGLEDVEGKEHVIHLKNVPGKMLLIPRGEHGLEPGLSKLLRKRRQLYEDGRTQDAAGLQVLVTMRESINHTTRLALTEIAGVEPSKFLPEVTLVFHISNEQAAEKLASVKGVARVDHMRPEYKFRPDLYASVSANHNRPEVLAMPRRRLGYALLQVSLANSWSGISGSDAVASLADKWRDQLGALGDARVVGRSTHLIVVEASLQALNRTVEWIASHEEVHTISPAPIPQQRGDAVKWVVQSGSIASGTTVWAKGINGTNQLVGVSDGGLDMTNCLFSNVFEGNGWGDLKTCEDCTMGNFYDDTDFERDGGVDYYYDQFYSNDPRYTDHCVWTSAECTSPQATRKVAAYLPFVHHDVLDADGHGSHVAGSVAGLAAEGVPGAAGVNQFQGIAPGARLAMVDVSYGTHGGLVFPPGNDTFAFDWAHQLGANVHSASWGYLALFHWEGYTESIANIDFHTFQNPDSLIVFAASNDGQEWGYGSIQPESQAKNVLTVGFTSMPVSQFSPWAANKAAEVFRRTMPFMCGANSGLANWAWNFISQVVDGCGSTPSEQTSGEVAFGFAHCYQLQDQLAAADPLVMSSQASLSAHLCGAQDEPNSVGALEENQEAFCCFSPAPCECKPVWEYRGISSEGCANPDNDVQTWCYVDSSCATALVGQFGHWVYCNAYTYPDNGDADCQYASCKGTLGVAVHAALHSLSLGSCCPQQSELDYAYFLDMLNENGTMVSPHSSRGPTWDGRIKPDVLAPGWTMSARSHNTQAWEEGLHCDAHDSVGAMQGTSMATPVVAGAAALVRQYFGDGFHACGVRDVARAVSPSAALVKAVLVSSARRPTSVFTMEDRNDDHGDCQETLVEQYPFSSRNSMCAGLYSNFNARCLDLDALLTTSDGSSVFCNYEGEGATCVHTLACCACKTVPFAITHETDFWDLEGYLCDLDRCMGLFGDDYLYRRRSLHSWSPLSPSTHAYERRSLLEEVQLGSHPAHVSITGHGQVVLDNAMMFEGDHVVLQVDDGQVPLDTGVYQEYALHLDETLIPASGGSLKITLVWTDPPASPSTAHNKALVNDLDLEVAVPGGAGEVYGNHLYELPADVVDAAGRDRVNNVEVVHLEGARAPAGAYAIRVRGHQVPRGPQVYSLVVNYVTSAPVKCLAGTQAMVTLRRAVHTNTAVDAPIAPPESEQVSDSPTTSLPTTSLSSTSPSTVPPTAVPTAVPTPVPTASPTSRMPTTLPTSARPPPSLPSPRLTTSPTAPQPIIPAVAPSASPTTFTTSTNSTQSLSTQTPPANVDTASPTTARAATFPTRTPDIPPTNSPSSSPDFLLSTFPTSDPDRPPIASPTALSIAQLTASPTSDSVNNQQSLPISDAVSFTLTFANLEISEFDDPSFDSSFRTQYISHMAAAAQVDPSSVVINNIAVGSVKVSSVVHFAQAASGKADAFIDLLSNNAGSVFSNDEMFANFGSISSSDVLLRSSSPPLQGFPPPLETAVESIPIYAPLLPGSVEESISDSSATARFSNRQCLRQLVKNLLWCGAGVLSLGGLH